MSGSAVQFEAVIVPHRSLSRRGFWWLAASLCTLSGGVSLGLWLAGAWPVIGFTGLEAVLAIVLLRWNAGRRQGSETLLLTDAGLEVVRTDRTGGQQRWLLGGGWLQATLEERPGRAPALLLRDGGVRLEVAAALGEAEKRDLAASLRTALARQRSPVFDNPQLRDG